jgi:hypothetical protein
MKTGIEQITEERTKQIGKYGWPGYHDSMYTHKELLKAAQAYLSACIFDGFVGRNNWPWNPETFKDEGYVENLKKAGALIAAELDRLNIS